MAVLSRDVMGVDSKPGGGGVIPTLQMRKSRHRWMEQLGQGLEAHNAAKADLEL